MLEADLPRDVADPIFHRAGDWEVQHDADVQVGFPGVIPANARAESPDLRVGVTFLHVTGEGFKYMPIRGCHAATSRKVMHVIRAIFIDLHLSEGLVLWNGRAGPSFLFEKVPQQTHFR